MIEVGISSSYAVGEKYEQIVQKLRNNGFTNIYTYPDYELEYEEIEQENNISKIEFSGQDMFEASSKFPYDIRVEITYHTLKNICVPISSKEAKKKNYKELESIIKAAGFVDVRIQEEDHIELLDIL